ncbi:hypothetical protein V7S43_013627 [Phytophthora oleae]|uniref:AGC-kinase C-terminal domain-containing protein n=1 Tax=Phytophthora oleae TaxID=2107226 RepID=A0ABD3F575_9STRA
MEEGTRSKYQGGPQRELTTRRGQATRLTIHLLSSLKARAEGPRSEVLKPKKVRFAEFQRAEALGHYGVLANDDSDDDAAPNNVHELGQDGTMDVDMATPDDFGFASDKLAQSDPNGRYSSSSTICH